MERLYNNIILDHFKHNEQMLFLAGPRQVGKTTTSMVAKQLTPNFHYFTWDDYDHRNAIINGQTKIAELSNLNLLQNNEKSVIIFDEIHKFSDWKNFLKGFYDLYKDRAQIIVTGSSRLDIFKSGGDSLMGRYFLHRMHPLSINEQLRTNIPNEEINQPKEISDDDFFNLVNFGGFPKPFLQHNVKFYNKWQRLRQQQLFREDIRDLSKIHDITRLEILAELLKHQASKQTNYTELAKKIRVSVDTISRWIEILESFYFCFTIKPWTKNITRSLLKEPKIYLWDWSIIKDEGAKLENFVASHLLKAVHFWTDQGFGEYKLHYLRDLEKREVDFIVTKNDKPWFLVEVKKSNNHRINKNLAIFQRQTNAPHAFQISFEADYIDNDCFQYHDPIIVPVKTFLSQLV